MILNLNLSMKNNMRAFKITIALIFFLLNSAATLAATTKNNSPIARNHWSELNKKIAPALVTVLTDNSSELSAHSKESSNWQYQDIYKKYFEDDAVPAVEADSLKSLGSGFLISKEGFILTNNNLIDNVGKIKIKLAQDNKTYFDATVIGRDPVSQIALLKISDSKPLPFISMGDSNSLQVGDAVAAFGSPSGTSNNMSTGIISRLGKNFSEVNRFPVLETSISTHTGNIGGPLVSVDGAAIGLNADIKNRIGLGFHIPASFIKEITPLMQKHGKLKRGTLGVRLDHNLDKSKSGARIESVKRNSQALAAGIEAGDVITKVRDVNVISAEDLILKLREIPAGELFPLTYTHVNSGVASEKIINLSLREFDATEKSENKTDLAENKKLRSLGSLAPHNLGFYIADSSSELRRDYKVPLSTPFGPIITKVDTKSPSEKGQLRVGDVIIEVNEKPIQDAGDVLRFLVPGSNTIKAARGKEILETITLKSE